MDLEGFGVKIFLKVNKIYREFWEDMLGLLK